MHLTPRRFGQVTVIALAAIALVAGSVPGAGADRANGERQLWIVQLRDGVDPDTEGRHIAEQHGGEVGHVYEHALNGYSFEGTESQARALARHPKVIQVDPDSPVEAFAETVPTGIVRIGAEAAHAAGDTGANVVVAVIDTGVDLDHPDLNLAGPGRDCVNDDFVADDDNGHGTHVAGTVAAAANGSGVLGVAPGVKIMPVKVLNSSGSGSWATVICGIDYVTANSGTIGAANMSLGGSKLADDHPSSCATTSLHQAICNSVGAGVFYAVAAGNSGADASGHVPAMYDQVTTVSALHDTNGAVDLFGSGPCVDSGAPWTRQCDDALAYFSNHGSAVDIMAPGVDILSTYPGGYASMSGTSMASPHVAGVAALVRAATPSMSPAQVEAHLQSTGECPDGTTNDGTSGPCSGQGSWTDDGDGTAEPLVDAQAAVGASDAPTTENAAPSASFTETCTDLTCEFTDTSTDSDGSVVSWEWDFGDGSTSTAQHPSHTYAEGGTYSVSLVVTDDGGKTSSTSNSVSVSESTSEPSPSGVTLSSTSINNGSTWTAVVTITGPAGSYSGTWSSTGSTSTCNIDSDGGSCSVQHSGIHKSTSSVTFALSTGESIVVNKP